MTAKDTDMEHLNSIDSGLEEISRQLGLDMDANIGNGVVEIFVRAESVFLGTPREANRALQLAQRLLQLSGEYAEDDPY